MNCEGIHPAHLASCQAGEEWGRFWQHDGPAPEFTILAISWVVILVALALWLGRKNKWKW